VHGGITLIKQINDKIMIGFDCAHIYDFSKTYKDFKQYHNSESIFRCFDYVKSEIHNLVDEIIEEGKYKP
jgi:hypothetical protein